MRGRCAECGFDAGSVSPRDAVVALRSLPRRWRAALALLDDDDADVLRRRPQPDVWSALEYAAHVRDQLGLHGWGMARTLTEDHPVFELPPDVDLDAAPTLAPADDVSIVLDAVDANAVRTAARVERTDAGDWRRPATIPGDGEVDALWFLHHAVHEGTHHLRDVERVLRQVRGRPA